VRNLCTMLQVIPRAREICTERKRRPCRNKRHSFFSFSHDSLVRKVQEARKDDEVDLRLHLETRKAIVSFLDPLVSQAKPDPYFEQLLSWLREVLKDSSAVRRSGPEVQEPYVIRCSRSFMRLS